MQQSRKPLLLVIAGPTGSGKSGLAVSIAREFGGEVVNCDSLQLYRYMDVGTAKATPEERQGVPHHLLDILDPDQVFTAGEYARVARPVIAGIADRGNLPIVAGGTGFYIRSLLEGLFPGPQRDERLREQLARRETRHAGWLYSLLQRHDPTSAGRIHATDVQKRIRAAEVLLVTRRPISSWFEEKTPHLEGYRILKLGLDPPRPELYARLDSRCERMFASGLLEEVQRIFALGFPAESKALEAHGYRQAVQVLKGEMNREEALRLAKRNTRHYAKRQWTWFRRDPEIIWLPGFGDEEIVEKSAKQHVSVVLCN